MLTTEPQDGPGLVYSRSGEGHRGNYVRLIQANLGLAPAYGGMSPAMALRLIRAPRLFVAMIEDSIGGFLLVCPARALLGRPTFALLLRPQTCFDGTAARHRLKKAALAVWRRLPGLTVATILPFEVDPRSAQVAHRGLHDPEFWDLVEDGGAPVPPPSELASEILARAQGRRIVVMLGALNRHKAFEAFAGLARTGAPDCLFVAAGKVAEDSRATAADFQAQGGLLVDRYLTDPEMQSLYGIADRVWACYAAEYDQASGIFGRAIQYEVVPIVRAGSRVHRFARIEGLAHEALDLASTGPATLPFLDDPEAAPTVAPRLRAWRERFWQAARDALSLDAMVRPEPRPQAALDPGAGG